MNDLTLDLDLARHLASIASEIALEHQRRGVSVERKPDGSPVTSADLLVERHLREILGVERPSDGVLGEEYGATGSSRRRWIIDPIDGTSNFIARRPYWGNHIALEVEGKIVLGVITRPARGASFWALEGHGAHQSDSASPSQARALRVSTTRELGLSRVTAWAAAGDPTIAHLKHNACWAEPNLDAILRLVSGELDALVSVDGRPWDHAPAVIIVEEAGGRFSDRHGGRRIDLEEVRYSNGALHAAFEQLLDSTPR